MTEPLHVEGHTGQVSFDGAFVTLHRSGFRARATVGKGEKRIPLSSIAAVQWKPAGPMANGFIQFTVPGGNERRSSFGSATNSAVSDENSVVFTRKQMPAFEQLRSVIEAAIAASHHPSAPQAASPASSADELVKLAGLRDQGILSEDEFAAAKARLLGS